MPLVAREAIVRLGSRVAGHEAVAAELARDRVDRPGHALIGPRKEADQRDIEVTGVELFGPVVLGEGPALSVVPLSADLAMYLVAGLLPAVEWRLQFELLNDPYRAVEHHPRHDL